MVMASWLIFMMIAVLFILFDEFIFLQSFSASCSSVSSPHLTTVENGAPF